MSSVPHHGVVIVLLLIALSPEVPCLLKKWGPDTDVTDPAHWTQESKSHKCNSFVLPRELLVEASMGSFSTHEIILPLSGSIEMPDGATITFTETSACAVVQTLDFVHWFDPRAWRSESNTATPDSERVPCAFDDVSFPDTSNVAVTCPEIDVTVRSFAIKKRNFTQSELRDFLLSAYGRGQFASWDDAIHLSVSGQTCARKGGCVCHGNPHVENWVCSFAETSKPLCRDPVRPSGHCSGVCGGLVSMKPGKEFVLKRLAAALTKRAEVDVHLSRIRKGPEELIQAVFTSKPENVDESKKIARAFYDHIVKFPFQYKVDGVVLELSGEALTEGAETSGIFSTIFWTFFLAACFFSLLYAYYEGPLKSHVDSKRWRRFRFARYFRSFSFSRFDDRGMSMAASVVSLERAFDNPLFGQARSSTGSHADGTPLVKLEPTPEEEEPEGAEEKLIEIEVEGNRNRQQDVE